MRAGLLNKNITILKSITNTSEYGGTSLSWEPDRNTKARVTFNSGDRLIDNSEIYHTQIISFEIRNYHKVNEEMRIRYKEKNYQILSIEEKYQTLILKCQLINE